MSLVWNDAPTSTTASPKTRPRVLFISAQLPADSGLVTALIDVGADVRCASAAREAALAALSWRPELAILVARESLQAVERVLAELHAYPMLRALRIVLVGSRTLADAPEPALRLGVDRVVADEVDAGEFVAWARGQCWPALPRSVSNDNLGHLLASRFDSALERFDFALRPIVSLASGLTVARQASPQLPPGDLVSFEAMQVLAQELAASSRLQLAIARRLGALWEKGASEDLFVTLPAEGIDLLLRLFEDRAIPALGRWVVELDEELGEPAMASRLDRLAQIREQGVRVALAECGSGASRLDLLADLRPEFVKIAPGLLRYVAQDLRRRQVLASMLGLCESLGGVVIASEPCSADDLAVFADLGGRFVQRMAFDHGVPFPLRT